MRGSLARDRKGKEGESAEELYGEEAKNDVARTRNTDKHISLPCVLVNLESRRTRTQNNVFVRGVL